ncbi:hypothetical protein FRX31_014721 [Thalictrum thalictroides]|uniref:Uncharacterized protein n=1 Tax=Thalictrum thalictroides TaxID=46969 RepID=A0A7J6WE71_THATH|nr:hypothetical protein FRX31_014721 [Thalictrum thalictroides]
MSSEEGSQNQNLSYNGTVEVSFESKDKTWSCSGATSSRADCDGGSDDKAMSSSSSGDHGPDE